MAGQKHATPETRPTGRPRVDSYLSDRRHRFPHAIWLYLRFTLSYRDVEDLLAERGLDVSYEQCGARC
jgi:hypothetical protein